MHRINQTNAINPIYNHCQYHDNFSSKFYVFFSCLFLFVCLQVWMCVHAFTCIYIAHKCVLLCTMLLELAVVYICICIVQTSIFVFTQQIFISFHHVPGTVLNTSYTVLYYTKQKDSVIFFIKTTLSWGRQKGKDVHN